MGKPKTCIKTPEFRGNFVYLAKPRSNTNEETGVTKEQYEIMIALPKNKPETKAFIAAAEKMINEAYQDKHGKLVKKEAMKHYPIKDGDNAEQEYLHGHWILNAKSNFRPSCVDKTGMELEQDSELYSGAWYKVKISAWGWNNPKSGKGVSLNIESVLKTKDDKRLGGGSSAKDDFADELDGDAAAGDLDDNL